MWSLLLLCCLLQLSLRNKAIYNRFYAYRKIIAAKMVFLRFFGRGGKAQTCLIENREF